VLPEPEMQSYFGRLPLGAGPPRGGKPKMFESVGTLAVTIRLERDRTRRGTLIGANLSGRLLIIDPREGT
jgi:hypothetical protein